MSKLVLISGGHDEDNLVLVVNSQDSVVGVSIDTDSNTFSFRRTVQELNLQEQVKLCNALKENIDKWKEELLTEEK